MPSALLSQIAVIVFAMACMGGIAYVLLLPRLDGSASTAKRVKSISARTPNAPKSDGGGRRRRQVEDAIKEIEDRNKEHTRKLTLKDQIRGSGLSWSVKKFWVMSVVFGIAAGAVTYLLKAPVAVTFASFFVFFLGFPRWLLKFLRQRRERAFLNEFVNAVDVIVRGVKACLRIVANESSEPVRGEFKLIVEAQTMGVTVSDAVQRMYERMPIAEVSFFAIVITLQQKTGGNLSDTLSNLSKVLRDRKKMKAKIIAMSQEAKASAAIIGALPLVVMGLVFLTSPDYIALLWTEKVGQLMLMGSAFWMFCGVMVMRKMINFDF